MPCESFQSALSEAAAGAPASAALRSHLIVCADCRAALAAEESLFASIDTGLRSAANAEVPASLIPSVRARLNEPAPRKRWLLPVLVPVAAALLLVALAARSFRHTSANPSQSAPLNAAASVAPQAPARSVPSRKDSLSATHPDREPRVAASSPTPRRAAVTLAKAETSKVLEVPEVLVSRDQEMLLASYAQQWRTHRYVRVTAQVISTPPLEPLEIAPIQIDVRDVKFMTDTGSR
jgi:hypothetical protein